MRIKELVLARSLLQLGLGGLICLLLTMGVATRAGAQEIEPYEFVPLPAGTNVALGYYAYGHNTEFNLARGSTIKDSGVETNIGIGRYVHYTELAGFPAGFQIIQFFGSLSGAHIDGQRLGSAFGAQNTIFSAFIWPYVNTATKTNVNATAFIAPPDGSYDKRSLVNLGDNRWRGTVQVGLSQGLTDSLAFDAAFDVQFYGDNDSYFPGNRRLSQDPTYRAQLWANWRWNPAFSTSLGYEGLFGGSQQVNGFFAGTKTEVQRLRAAASLFLTPRLQTVLEINHDIKVVGGFKQDIGTILRVAYVF